MYISSCLIYLLLQSDVEGDDSSSIRKFPVTLSHGLHCSELRAPPPHVVLVVGRNLVTEVELADEGLTTGARSPNLKFSLQTSFLIWLFLYFIVDVRDWTQVVSSGETSKELVASVL